MPRTNIEKNEEFNKETMPVNDDNNSQSNEDDIIL
jgi:hypothetical protein